MLFVKNSIIIRYFIPLTLFVVFIVFVGGCDEKKKVSKITVKKLKTIQNSLAVELILIPSGRFVMGEASYKECNTCNAAKDEMPRHWVTISRSFYISKYEITQKQWLVIMNLNPSEYKGDQRPVENVSWKSVNEFIFALNKKENTKKYRLPTEAEWEYAARAGTETAFAFGDSYGDLKDYGWYLENSSDQTHAVGLLFPNAWGLYDMHGNVYEWCRDIYSDTYYANSPARDPKGARRGLKRVRRGGAFNVGPRRCRVSDRDAYIPETPIKNTGFRLVMDF